MSVTVTKVTKSSTVSLDTVDKSSTSTTLDQGGPIGLLLALTYASAQSFSGLTVTLTSKS